MIIDLKPTASLKKLCRSCILDGGIIQGKNLGAGTYTKVRKIGDLSVDACC
jgi:hypothetical protein